MQFVHLRQTEVEGHIADVVLDRPETRNVFNTEMAYQLLEILQSISKKMAWKRAGEPGEEAGIVMRGELQVMLNGRVIHLYEGDNIYFSSTTPHRYINPGTCISLSVWAMAR
ncbi:cupin domain-containing protein [Aneurinibacillus tyrosinisolvens]|uniref:cupin domain-containing protein n=1 Tax=Aneurinibacillus tyrosinisolvens TaxID=1443435 RepID=UPI000699CBC9|nr:cupin domain-containing protein [Aneurinibacillus tyrosinisolvens]